MPVRLEKCFRGAESIPLVAWLDARPEGQVGAALSAVSDAGENPSSIFSHVNEHTDLTVDLKYFGGSSGCD